MNAEGGAHDEVNRVRDYHAEAALKRLFTHHHFTQKRLALEHLIAVIAEITHGIIDELCSDARNLASTPSLLAQLVFLGNDHGIGLEHVVKGRAAHGF